MIKTESPGIIHVSAFSQNLVDLDEHADCESLGKLIEERARGVEDLESITLDLRKCWLEYAHCSLFLDKTLLILSESDFAGEKRLEIETSIHFGSPELMASLFFQISSALGCSTSDSSSDVVKRVDAYCVKKNISISVKVYSSGGSDSGSSANENYVFPSA